MNKETMKQLFPQEEALVDAGKCPFCKKDIDLNGFRNPLSKLEFEISGLCQKCQDDFFGKD